MKNKKNVGGLDLSLSQRILIAFGQIQRFASTDVTTTDLLFYSQGRDLCLSPITNKKNRFSERPCESYRMWSTPRASNNFVRFNCKLSENFFLNVQGTI